MTRRVLVVDHGHSPICGIHDLGLRIFDRIAALPGYAAAHTDCDSDANYWRAVKAHQPHVVIVNYRADLMPWWRQILHHEHPTRVGVLHNYETATVDRRAAELIAHGFDWALVLEPDLPHRFARIATIGRPLPQPAPTSDPPGTTRQVGSFGFAFPHKGFADVAAEIGGEAGDAVYDLHMPEAYFNGAQGQPLYTDGILAAIGQAAPDVTVQHTANHLTGRQLVDRLAANDVNCLFYAPGQPDAGVSSALDYLIAAGRPILTTDCAMFRPGAGWLPTWPATRLGAVYGDWETHRTRVGALARYQEDRFIEGLANLMERTA